MANVPPSHCPGDHEPMPRGFSGHHTDQDKLSNILKTVHSKKGNILCQECITKKLYKVNVTDITPSRDFVCLNVIESGINSFSEGIRGWHETGNLSLGGQTPIVILEWWF